LSTARVLDVNFAEIYSHQIETCTSNI